MSEATSPIPQASVQQWQKWQMHALERVRLPFAWRMPVFVAAGAAWAVLSTYLRQIATGKWEATDFREGLVTVAVCVAILLYLRRLKRVSIKALCELRSVVPIPTEQYERLAQRMLAPQRGAEVLLLAISTVVFVLLYIVPPNELLVLPRNAVLDWLALLYLSGFACLAIWIVLTLVYCGLRSSLALRALAQSPLIVNVFDPAALLPFGRLGAMHSLAFVGVALVPMVLLGPPKAAGGYAVLSLSVCSLAVLFVPLWGVHRQIVKAREQILDSIACELMAVQTRYLGDARKDPAEARLLYEQAEKLSAFRRCVLSGPTWPFRDNGAIARVVTALLFPSLVAFISVFMQRVVFPLLTHAP